MLKQFVQCDCCGKIWNVSCLRDVSRGYVCPECDARMSGKKTKRREGR